MEDFTNNHNVRLYGKNSTLIFYALLLRSVLKDRYPGLLKKIVFFLIDGKIVKEFSDFAMHFGSHMITPFVTLLFNL